jgi:hypothetical protein
MRQSLITPAGEPRDGKNKLMSMFQQITALKEQAHVA